MNAANMGIFGAGQHLQGLWVTAVAERYALAPRSAVPLLDTILLTYANTLKQGEAAATHERDRVPEVLSRARQQGRQTGRGQSRG